MMPHPERAAFKKDRDTINNSRNTGMDWTLLGQPGRVHPISGHVAWRRTVWENQLDFWI